jgi:hypothetical protein
MAASFASAWWRTRLLAAALRELVVYIPHGPASPVLVPELS